MANLPLLNTAGLEWTEPADTNPRGFLAANPRVHPNGGLVVRDDAVGQGLAANLLGAPAARSWAVGVPIIGMPLKVTGDNELWAPPYPQVTLVQTSSVGLSLGAPSGVDDQVTEITSPLVAAIVNDTSYQMQVSKRVITRNAKLVSPRKTVGYGLMVDGVPWQLFTGSPAYQTSVIETSETVTVETVSRTWLTGVDVINAIVPAEHTYSGSLDLPSVVLAPGETATVSVAVAIFYQETTDAFDARVGEMTLELVGKSIVNTTFGEAAV